MFCPVYAHNENIHKWKSYDVWCMVSQIWSVTDRIFCHFRLFFALLPPPPSPTPKSKFWKNEKSAWRYHFTLVFQKSWPYATLFLRYEVWWMQFSFFILGFFLPCFPPPPPPLPKTSKIKILEKWKKTWKYQYYRNYTCVSKILIPGCICHDVQLLRYGAPWRDGQMDGETGRQIKWHREVSAPPKKYWYRH